MRADEASEPRRPELLQLTQSDQMLKMMEPMMKGMMAQAGKDMTAEQRAKASRCRRR